MRWEIPEPIPVGWRMRELSSAKIDVRELPDGTFEQTIEQAPLPGVTPEMMLWWLANMEKQVEWEGRRFLAYRLWHPRDHIHFRNLRRRDGTIGPGMRFHIVEAFGGERRFLVDDVAHITRYDLGGFRLEFRVLGQAILSVDELFRPRSGGMGFEIRMRFGSAAPVVGAITRAARKAKMPMLTRWLQHKVEEDGNLPHFLPKLYGVYGETGLPG